MLGFGPLGSHPIGALPDSALWNETRDGENEGTGFHASAHITTAVVELSRGRDFQRRIVLDRIIDGEFQDRNALSTALIHELSNYEVPKGDSDESRFLSSESHAAARSWLRAALIWCQPEDPKTIKVAERGLDPKDEPFAFVRFWTLAAVAGTRASYLRRLSAFAASDPAWDVEFLGRMILSPDLPELISEIRDAFDGNDLGKLHGILRALRIAPIPAVVSSVAGLMATNARVEVPAYDVFCALATPAMALPAAEILSLNPGFESVIGAMVLSAAIIDKSTAENFARLLVAMDPVRSESFLRARLAIPELRSGAQVLLNAVVGSQLQPMRHLPGYISDSINGQVDHLEIQAEVNTLTAIMMAKDVTPPLAIGLFGEWGTGKSFFMARMKQTVNELIAGPAQTVGSPFCANAVQIHFNAWHYADTNLWASLVSSIFEGLDSHLRVKDVLPDERDVLVQALTAATAAKDAARVEEEHACERLKQEQAKLAAASADRENKLSVLSSLQASDIADLLRNDEQLRTNAENALRELGLPAVMDSVTDLRRALVEARSLTRRAVTMLSALSRDRAGRSWFILFAALAVLSPLLVDFINGYLGAGSQTAATISAHFLQIVGLTGSAAAMLRRGTVLFVSVLAPLEEAKRRADKLLAEKRDLFLEEEKRLRQKVDVLKNEEQNAREKFEAALKNALIAQQKLNELDQSRTLAYFVAERRASTDYRKHLGLVSVVRQDFELLVDRINQANRDESGEQKLDRIILYIDDLDRCQSDKVVDVLQAVHLLLAYPLFVVVVGVDARWLLNSLTLHYKELGMDAENFNGGRGRELTISSQHYLEKIFQIPYALRPMNRNGYGRLIAQLMGDATGKAAVVAPEPLAISADELPAYKDTKVASPAEPPTETDFVGRQSKKVEPAITTLHSPTQQYFGSATENSVSPIAERALIIQPWEMHFAQLLFALSPSPRSAKRLINVYRVLKAGVTGDELTRFEGTRDAPGDFQVPLLLLAILICDASAANDWFAELLREQDGETSRTLPTILCRIKGERKSFERRLMLVIEPIVKRPDFPQDPALLTYWLPRVARFSFHAWHGPLQE